MTNLISNGLKFTEEGGVTLNIEADSEYVHLCVADTGIGIGPTFLTSLFEEFKQESTGIHRTYEGNGLGLAITHRLIELMYGTISVESTKGVGSVFKVRLPRWDKSTSSS